MKNRVLVCVLLGALCLVICLMMLAKEQRRQTDTQGTTALRASIPDAPLTNFSFSERHTYLERVQRYEFRIENGQPTVFFTFAHEEELYPVTVDDGWVSQLTEIIRQYGILAWDGFCGSREQLLDGTGFRLEIAFASGATVSASGYGRFPGGYGEAVSAMDGHFMQLLPETLRDW